MLEGGTKEEVLGACPMQCRRGRHLSSSQVADDIVIITHLPENGTKITCDDGFSHAVVHDFKYGAFRLTLPYSCRVWLNNKVSYI
jgi:hypothetical protein